MGAAGRRRRAAVRRTVKSVGSEWRRSRRKRLEATAIAALGYPAIGILGHTWRWRTSGLEHFDEIFASGRFPVMAFWHGRILPACTISAVAVLSSSRATISTASGWPESSIALAT